MGAGEPARGAPCIFPFRSRTGEIQSMADDARRSTPPTAATILVVHDDPQTAELARQALAGDRVEVIGVGSAAEAESTLAEREVAVIVLALVLPDADGRQVYSRLSQQSRTAGIPVIMVAQSVGNHTRDECLALGVAAWLERPLDTTTLRAAVEDAVRTPPAEGHALPSDAVTGLGVRVTLAEAYEREVVHGGPGATPSTIALIDVDGVEQINETRGRAAGDELLRQVAQCIAASLHAADVLVRWRDDEFAVLLTNRDVSGAKRLLAKVQATLTSSPPIGPDGEELAVTFGAGIASVQSAASFEEVMAEADRALGRAKSLGPSRVVALDDAVPEAPTTVLVAEDDRVTATLVKHRLERSGFDVVHALTGTDALASAERGEIGLFILDIRMPGMDGFELLTRLRTSPGHASTPILMLTNLGREEDIVRAFDLGANDYVTKPFSPIELLARVQRLLRTQASSSTGSTGR